MADCRWLLIDAGTWRNDGMMELQGRRNVNEFQLMNAGHAQLVSHVSIERPLTRVL